MLGKTSGGYANHPQLLRFRAAADGPAAIGDYLTTLADEADDRGYKFDRSKIQANSLTPTQLPLTTGQLDYEWQHLLAKLEVRSPDVKVKWADVARPEPNPIFHLVTGPIAEWEKI